MQAGVVHLVESGEAQLESVREEIDLPDDHEFDSLVEAIEIAESIELPDGKSAQLGRAAAEQVSETSEVRVREEGITEYTAETKTTRYTEFFYIPNEIFVVDSSSGNFAVDVINRHTSASILPAQINLDEYLRDSAESGQGTDIEVDLWKVGFYDTRGLPENGVLHGQNLLEDSEVGGALRSARKNQVGIDYTYDQHPLRAFLAESGYVEVYQPSDFPTRQFAQFLLDEVSPHLIPE